MGSGHNSLLASAILRVRHVWSELDHAQRRLFEIQTGIPTRRDR